MEELASLTKELVAIPSHEDPTAVGDRIEEWLRRQTEATVLRDAAGNVIARRSPEESTDPLTGGSHPSLALVGHHDVVPPDDAQVAEGGYVVEERDGRLYGRGSADMKGAVAAAMVAFRDADLADDPDGGTDAGDRSDHDLVFASFVGEEIGGEGARHAIEEGFAPDRAIVGEGSTGYSEPGLTDVALAHKGRRASTIAAHGESVHASVPEDGVNAIYRACEVVDDVRALDPPAVDVAGDRLEGSLAVTGIEGGTAWNVVPSRCEITVDERTVPDERANLESVVDREGVEWIVDQDLPPMQCGDEAFGDQVLAAARAHHDPDVGGRPEHVVKPHATDAGWLAGAGTECVICGPAEPGEAHTAEESVSLGVLDRCRAIYEDAAERFPPR